MKFRLDAIRHGFCAAYLPAAGAFSCLLKPCFVLCPACSLRFIFIFLFSHFKAAELPLALFIPREVRSVADLLKSAQSSVLRIFPCVEEEKKKDAAPVDAFFFSFFLRFFSRRFLPLHLLLPTPQHNACVGCTGWIVSRQRTGLG